MRCGSSCYEVLHRQSTDVCARLVVEDMPFKFKGTKKKTLNNSEVPRGVGYGTYTKKEQPSPIVTSPPGRGEWNVSSVRLPLLF